MKKDPNFYEPIKLQNIIRRKFEILKQNLKVIEFEKSFSLIPSYKEENFKASP